MACGQSLLRNIPISNSTDGSFTMAALTKASFTCPYETPSFAWACRAIFFLGRRRLKLSGYYYFLICHQTIAAESTKNFIRLDDAIKHTYTLRRLLDPSTPPINTNYASKQTCSPVNVSYVRPPHVYPMLLCYT